MVKTNSNLDESGSTSLKQKSISRLSKSFKKPRQKKDKKKVKIVVGSKSSHVTIGMLKEMKKLQATIKDLIPKMPFCRLIREVMQNYGQFLIQRQALEGIQYAAEMYLTQLFEDGNLCAAHARRVTLMPPDVKLVLRMRSRYDPIAE